MTLQEVGQVMDIITMSYPAFYAKKTDEEKYETSVLWASLFEPYPVELVAAAVKSFIGTDEKGYPPVPGQIMAKVRLLTKPEEMTEAEAWNLVRKAAGNSIYNAQKEFDKLPPVLQRLVGSPNQLREWGMMEGDEFQTVVASNFQRSYRARAASEREYLALPPDVRALADRIGGRLALNGGDTGGP